MHGAWIRNSAKWHTRVNAGSKLATLYSILGTPHCQQHWLSSGKASYPLLAQLQTPVIVGNVCCYQYRPLVRSPPAVRKWPMSVCLANRDTCCSVPTTHISLTSKRVTSEDHHCHLVSQVIIHYTWKGRHSDGPTLAKYLEYECLPNKPVVGTV